MIELVFVKNSAMRKVYIKDREITLITPELNYQPMKITIPQLKMALESGDDRIKDALEENDIDLDKYVDDNSIAEEIIKDFQEYKWRCIKR